MDRPRLKEKWLLMLTDDELQCIAFALGAYQQLLALDQGDLPEELLTLIKMRVVAGMARKVKELLLQQQKEA